MLLVQNVQQNKHAKITNVKILAKALVESMLFVKLLATLQYVIVPQITQEMLSYPAISSLLLFLSTPVIHLHAVQTPDA